MRTVYVVAIITAAVGILTLAYVFRKRLTRLGLSFRGSSLELEAEPDRDPGVTGLQPIPGTGVILDGSRIDRSTVEADNAPVVAHDTNVKKSNIRAAGSPQPRDRTDG
jgi:hypothetical protein